MAEELDPGRAARMGDRVRIHYEGRTREDKVFDSTRGREPLELRIGDCRTIAPLEEALIGMRPGQRKLVMVPARRGFGERMKHLVRAVSRDLLPPGSVVRPGQRLRLRLEEGQEVIVRVIRAGRREILVDTNHPLAGEDLAFDVELVEIL